MLISGNSAKADKNGVTQAGMMADMQGAGQWMPQERQAGGVILSGNRKPDQRMAAMACCETMDQVDAMDMAEAGMMSTGSGGMGGMPGMGAT